MISNASLLLGSLQNHTDCVWCGSLEKSPVWAHHAHPTSRSKRCGIQPVFSELRPLGGSSENIGWILLGPDSEQPSLLNCHYSNLQLLKGFAWIARKLARKCWLLRLPLNPFLTFSVSSHFVFSACSIVSVLLYRHTQCTYTIPRYTHIPIQCAQNTCTQLHAYVHTCGVHVYVRLCKCIT